VETVLRVVFVYAFIWACFRTLGKREVAKAKCQLLVQALLLDGRNDLAAEVEALAQAE